MITCPTCTSTDHRRDFLRPPSIRVCLCCGQTFEIVQEEQ